MKKIITTLALIITLVTGAFGSNKKIDPEVLNAFKNQFTNAQEVTWVAADNYYKATFFLNGEFLFAFYNTDAELLGVIQYISSTELPENLRTSLKKNYTGYWIADLFEVVNGEGTSYYITLQNADTQIILQSKNQTSWRLFPI
jgi:hypothetical protein